ncbi:sterile alpha motif domain-containing protein 9-like, partial [Saccostrea cucullata]|uniref:sterile alpha motif domain-containing protein 9-like n=1 Tax=Saccostrea cuccullata TaxID=36930 RepID=UPI002ED51D60
MDFEGKERIRCNYTALVNDVDADRIKDFLYENGTIEHDELQRIGIEKTTDNEKVQILLEILDTKTNGYEQLLLVLKKDNRGDLVDLLQGTNVDMAKVEEERSKEQNTLIQVIKCNFEEKKDETIDADVLEHIIRLEYLRERKKVFHGEINKIEKCLKEVFPVIEIRKRRSKKASMAQPKKLYQHIHQKCTQIELNSESTSGSREMKDASKEEVLLKDISVENLGAALRPLFLEKELDESVLEMLKEEKISGRLFAEFTLDDIKEVCPAMPYGYKKTLLQTKDAILDKEKSEGPFLLVGNLENQQLEPGSNNLDEETDPPWQRLRALDTLTNPAQTYHKNAVVRSANLYRHNLIEPIQNFVYFDDGCEQSLIKCIQMFLCKFIAACLTERTNGIIYFGIEEKMDRYGEKCGIIKGFKARPSKITQIVYETLQTSFFADQLHLILRCIRPPQFIKITENPDAFPTYVVEIDVLPSFELTKYRTFYQREKFSRHVLSVYTFKEGRPSRMNDEELKHYNETKSDICDNREKMEKSRNNLQTCANLRQHFLDLYSAGSGNKLVNEIYPVLILSPLDPSVKEKLEPEKFEFLIDIDPCVIFDFHPTAEGEGLFNAVDKIPYYIVKPYIIEDFDRKKEDNIIAEVENNRQALPGWVFCNGYEPLDMKTYKKLDWKTKRSESFKEAIRIYQNCIPSGRAFVIFAVFSTNYDIMLEIAEEVILKFQNQWIVLAEDASLLDKWKYELIRRSSVDSDTFRKRCVAGIPWQYLTQIVKEVKNIQRSSECQLSNSCGGSCHLKSKLRSELCDLDILSKKECEESEITKDTKKLEEQSRKAEEEFYRGTRVSWWNMYFKDHALKRSQHGQIAERLKNLLMGKFNEDDSKVVIFQLYHQPGCGGTTIAMQILWSLKKIYRCCIVRRLTDQTHNQIQVLREYEDKNPMPPVVLIDNEDELKITSLRFKLEQEARVASRHSESKLHVYCLLFRCIRRVHLPNSIDLNSFILTQSLETDELEWFRRKHELLCQKHNENPKRDVNPKYLISFNLLKENFDADYIQRNAALYVKGVEDEKERKLLLYLSLINTFDMEFQSIPLSSFDFIMSGDSGAKKTIMTFSMRYRVKEGYEGDWETHLSNAIEVLLSRNIQVNTGSQGIQIVSKVFARALLLNMLKEENIPLHEAVCRFLECAMLKTKSFSITVLKRILQDILKKREESEKGKKEMFSPLVTHILQREGGDRAAEVLECGFERTKDAMIAQQTARLYIFLKNWTKAEEFAEKAVTERPDNSYLWDTYGQIYLKRLADIYESCLQDKRFLTTKEIQDVVEIAVKGMSYFEKEQFVSEREQFATDNDAGYFAELKTIVMVLDLFTLWNPDRGKLHKFLVSENTPSDFKIFEQKRLVFLKGLHNRSENALTKLDDKYSQLKNIYKAESTFNPFLEVIRLRENLDVYFGEGAVEMPTNLLPKDVASYCRRRINRIGGRSLVSILRLRNEDTPDNIFLEIYEKAKWIIDHGFASLHDYLTLLGVSLVRSIDSDEDMDFESMIQWSSMAYKMVTDPSNEDRPNLEAFMYFVIIHWPTESRRKYQGLLCSPEEIAEAIRRWKKAFRKIYPRQEDTNLYRKKETTYFFLGNGRKDIIYYEELGDNSRYQDVFRTEKVRTRLQRLKGILLRDGWEIKYAITSLSGNSSSIGITNSFPTSSVLWNRTVYFYVGFSWNGPKAFCVTREEDPTISTTTELPEEGISRQSQTKKTQNEFEKYESVSTLNKLSKALRDIDRRLEKSKKKKGRFQTDEK